MAASGRMFRTAIRTSPLRSPALKRRVLEASGFRLPPSAFRLPPSAFWLLASAFCLLASAFCRPFAFHGEMRYNARVIAPSRTTTADRAPVEKPNVPHHELLRVIGQGAYGVIWMARSLTGALRAVKV